MSNCRYPDIKFKMSSENGNIFSIMGRLMQTLEKNNVPQAEIDECMADMQSSDYDHALQTVFKWVDVT